MRGKLNKKTNRNAYLIVLVRRKLAKFNSKIAFETPYGNEKLSLNLYAFHINLEN